jgi:23S rRNA (adenine2503-C2)-methyltransferase
MDEKQDILCLTHDRLRENLAGHEPFRAGQVLRWIYAKRAGSFDEMTDLPSGLRAGLDKRFGLALPVCLRRQGDPDGTRKFLFALADGQRIETVLIPASPALYGRRSDRLTLCVSSQVGCAYGCKFCASGLDGWKRNLTAGEMVAQVLAAEKLAGETISNIVFMGMGEPFSNYDNLMEAITIINAPWGRGLGARSITVSTSGLADKIRAFAEQPLQIRLAVSLHAPTNDLRDRIMPVNTRFPIEDLFDACEYFSKRKKQRITFEYLLIAGVNDARAQAVGLAEHCRRFMAKVNLIPFNAVPGVAWERPDDAVQNRFLEVLRSRGIPATLRREKGHAIAAACGQLRLEAAQPPAAKRKNSPP